MKSKNLPRAGLCVCAAVVAGCQTVEPPPFNPKTIQEIQLQTATGQPYAMRPLPTTLESPLLPRDGTPPTTIPVSAATQPAMVGPAIRMTLQEVIHRAVVNNPDVKVSGYDSAVNAMRVIEAQARFDPTFFTNAQIQKQTTPNSSSTGFFTASPIANPFESTAETVQSGVRQLLPTGAQIEARVQSTRNDYSGTFSDNPFFDNQLVLQITQPLLRDAGEEVNTARISVARNDRKISYLDWRLKMEQTLADLEKAYWQLAQAQQNVRIEEQLLERTIVMANILARRWGQDVSNVQLSQANATIEQRRAALVRARARIGDLSDTIKRLMGDPGLPVTSPVTVLPADQPVEEAITFDLADQIATAMENRADLAQQLLRVDSAKIVTKVGKNNLLPQLNLQASVGGEGFDTNFGEASRNAIGGDFVNYAAGLAFEVPIGNREARAIYRRTLLQYQQSIDQYRTLTDQTALEVSGALREVRTSWDEMQATRRARLAAAEALRTIEVQETDVARTPPFVQLKLDRQAALADAALAEAQAIANYNVALSALERTKGTLLRYNNVVLDEEKLPDARLP